MRPTRTTPGEERSKDFSKTLRPHVIIALTLLTSYAVKLAILGNDEYLREADVSEFPAIRRIADILSIYVIAICLINLVSVVLQCGFGECHTFGYKLLQ